MLSAQSGWLGPVSYGITPVPSADAAPTTSTTEVSLPPSVARPPPHLRSWLKGKAKAEAQLPPPTPKQEQSLRAGGALRHFAGEEGDELPDGLSSNDTFSCTSYAPYGRFSHQSSQSSFAADYEDYGESEDEYEQPTENSDEETLSRTLGFLC